MRIKIHKDVIIYKEEGEIILINMMKNKFYTLDEFSSYIWTKFSEYSDVSKLIDFISGKYKIDKKTVKRDILDFIYGLARAGIVKVYE
ncbi:PqqD family protein [Bacillus velezensis]|uniref:PqqD family protein n=2 Tax=Bacillus velezensis TaxID=492670 RepID=UPI0007F8DFE7|nr:PqqD family protein [Bacillus velezensis]AWQ15992.1 PqqD family protein [Bacillus velezensis]MEC0446380.1 PqqD family protein [Bacillus velezensis]QMI87117.1 PqqD family protein [Bacillus velezensis]UBM46553.1 PqqD family protein [Bacillus velezensis]WJM69631.1 PqqD family protein [Bacillus velezensis]